MRGEINKSPHPASAFLLDDLDEKNEYWGNFYLKFRYALVGTDYAVLVAEDNDGGHELELGEVRLEDLFVFKRNYERISIEKDIEYEKFDAMMGTLFDLMDENGRVALWNTTAGLVSAVKDVVADTA